MGDTIITTNDDEIAVITTPEKHSYAIHAEAEGLKIVMSTDHPSLVIHAEAKSDVISEADLSAIIHADEPASFVIAATGSGGGGNFYRGIINYDGGHAGTHYGDLAYLDGGGAADGRRYPI